MLDNIIDAKVKKRLSEISLTGQSHMAVEGAPVIAKYMKQLAQDSALPDLEVAGFQHWTLGQESS
jgi:translation elongation factor EF-Ts